MIDETHERPIYDRPEALLAALGSFWSEVYAHPEDVQHVARAKCLVEQQTWLDTLQLLASVSRLTIPLYDVKNWYRWSLLKSDQITAESRRYGDGSRYDDGFRYDQTVAQTFAYKKPKDLVYAPVLLDRVVSPKLSWHAGIDFETTDETIIFSEDPFTRPELYRRETRTAGQPDTELEIWVYRGEWDWDAVYRQFGYLLGHRMRTSAGARDVVNAVLDVLTTGSPRSVLPRVLSAVTGVPLAATTGEIVTAIEVDAGAQLVITDKRVYRFRESAVPSVDVGDTLTAYQSLTDALVISELNTGQIPTGLRALSLDDGWLAGCFYSELLFENHEVPLQVDTTHPSGYTYVSWPLGGLVEDVRKFFDAMHARGVADASRPIDPCSASQTVQYPANTCEDTARTGRRGTLAHLLDRRRDPVGEPGPASLPRTINPLQFLIQNVLRENAVVVQIRADALGQTRLPLSDAAVLRQVLPPHIGVFVVLTLTPPRDSVTMASVTTDGVATMETVSLADPVGTAHVTVHRPSLRRDGVC